MAFAWEEWTEALLGVWLMVSPWVLGFATSEVIRNVAVATGLVTLVLALWTLLTDKDYRAVRSDSTAAQ